jgi:hypothetical protein
MFFGEEEACRDQAILRQTIVYYAALIVLPVCVVTLLYVQTTQIVERLCMDNYIASLSERLRRDGRAYPRLRQHGGR